MKKEDALKLSEEALFELAEALAAGKSEQLVAYLETMGRFHRYSFGNCMLIAKQRPTATQVAGFGAWKKLGRTVKKGEKGICILAPMIRKKKEESEDDKQTGVFGYRTVFVFDVSQTEGDELPEPNSISGDPGEQLHKLREVTSARGIELVYLEDLGGAEGRSKGGLIELRSGLTAAEDFSVLAHELAHESLHHSTDREKWPPKGIRELEAEAVAFVVSKAAGLTNALKQSADYIQSYQGDVEALTASLSRIQKTASGLITELESDSIEKRLQLTTPSNKKEYVY